MMKINVLKKLLQLTVRDSNDSQEAKMISKFNYLENTKHYLASVGLEPTTLALLAPRSTD